MGWCCSCVTLELNKFIEASGSDDLAACANHGIEDEGMVVGILKVEDGRLRNLILPLVCNGCTIHHCAVLQAIVWYLPGLPREESAQAKQGQGHLHM